ncbi:MAG: SBBP repeat-containing protein, partial [Acidobacteriota bacterium]|nr:SBBP repeat-containing protein [Acidobacteriota bacterium]
TASPATQILIAGSQLFVATAPSTDLFVAKLDALGTIVYSTYFGGSGADTAAGLAAGADGSVYVTGSTTSFDFPVTDGVYLSNPSPMPSPTASRSFVFKLNPDGSLAWSTYFADSRTTPLAIAVDQTGSPYVTGSTYGGLPVTDDAYQKTFTPISPCGGIGPGPCPPTPTSAFLTKFQPERFRAGVFNLHFAR